MAIPITPTNFNVQTGNGQNYLSWDQISDATTYLVQRSLDNITFILQSTITGTPLNNYYLDDVYDATNNPNGVRPGVQYYYKIAAQNGDGTSGYTTSQGIIPAKIGQVSLQWVRLMATLRADLINSQFISLPEWNSYISNSYKDLYNFLVQHFDDEYYSSSTYTFVTDGSSQLYALPDDFYKATLVEVSLNTSDPNSWVTLRRYNKIQQNLWNYPNVYTFYGVTNIRYRFTGNNLEIVPITQAGQYIRIWYAPRPRILMADTDILDGIAGYEDYVILSAARKAMLKQEQDVSEIDRELAFIKENLEEAATNRDVSEPATVSDSRMRNFAWSDDGGYSGNSGWGW
jgi:hypothetical protein